MNTVVDDSICCTGAVVLYQSLSHLRYLPISCASLLSLSLIRLDRIEGFVSRVSGALQAASQDPSAHLYDPVNAYQLVNRFINGWAKLHKDVYDENGKGPYVVCVGACMLLCLDVSTCICLCVTRKNIFSMFATLS